MTGFIRNKFVQNVVKIVQYVCENFVEFLFVSYTLVKPQPGNEEQKIKECFAGQYSSTQRLQL